MWILTTYYNPLNLQRRKSNFDIFYNKLKRQGANVLLVELVYNNVSNNIRLAVEDIHIKIPCNNTNIIWQKECLINIGLKSLPASCKYVTLLDADVIFLNNNWIEDTINVLKCNTVVQPFDEMYYTNKNGVILYNEHKLGYIYNYINTGKIDNHFHVGLAWSTTIELFKKLDMFDKAVIGSADTIFAQSCLRDMNNFRNILSFGIGYPQHIREYAYAFSKKLFELVQGNVGYCKNNIIHLWHGYVKNRNYLKRANVLSETKFNIDDEIFKNNYDIWEWYDTKSPSYNAIYNYLISRKEDG